MKLALSFFLLATLYACTKDQPDPVPLSDPIRVAVLPDQSIDKLLLQFEPLLDYLASTTSLKYELEIPPGYSELLDRFDAGQIDLAWFGGLTFTRAELRSQAVPLVFRDIDLRFASCYLARTSDTRKSVTGFEGEQFSFGPVLSTSGHLMPRFFMAADNLDPEQFFAATRHSAGHDQTAAWVADGTVDLGVANCSIVQSLIENESLHSREIHIIGTTPPYSNYVWAISPSLDSRTKLVIRDAFLSLDVTTPEHRKLLRAQGANTFLPAKSEDFQDIRNAAIMASMLTENNDN
jgi:phosphonate transport system substrate-binding protein